jgi:hypothetical protein
MRLYCCLNPSATRVNAQLVDAWGKPCRASHRGCGEPGLAAGPSSLDRLAGTNVPADSELQPRSYVRTLMEVQFLVQNRKLCYIFALVGSIERRGQKRIEQPAEGRTDFFCNCQTGPQCWKPPSTGLILRRPLPEAKGLEGRSRRCKRGNELDHPSRPEASLPSSGRGRGFRRHSEAPPGQLRVIPFA